MSYCVGCGLELPRDDAKFCPYCGCKQPARTGYVNTGKSRSVASSSTPHAPYSPSQPKKKSIGDILPGTIGIIVAIFIVISLAGGIAVFVFGIPIDVQNPFDSFAPATNSASALDSTPGMQTPQDVFTIYENGFQAVNEDVVWGVLSSGAQEESSKDKISTIIHAYFSSGYTVLDYTITDAQIDGDTGQLLVTLDASADGFEYTSNKEVPFVRENGAWKIDEFIVLA